MTVTWNRERSFEVFRDESLKGLTLFFEDLMRANNYPLHMMTGLIVFTALSLQGCQSGGDRAAGPAASRSPGAKEGKSGKEGRGDRVVPVKIAKVERANVPIEVQAVGTVTPYSVVPITAQATGQLTKVHFRQGDFVAKGDLLFSLDSRPQEAAAAQSQAVVGRDQATLAQGHANLAKDQATLLQLEANIKKDEAAVEQAKANLRRDEAQFEFLKQQAERYRNLVASGYVTTEQAQQQIVNATSFEQTLAADRAAVASAEAILQSDRAARQGGQAILSSDRAAIAGSAATMQADRALAQASEIQLDYTTIRSPITGRTGTLNIHEGTLVRANDTAPLVSISQIQPIYVTFSVPEKFLDQIQTGMKRGILQAEVRLENTDFKERGRITFVENTVDSTTGTITLRATFQNLQKKLWPGRFANVTLQLGDRSEAITVPATAVQAGQKGDFVFIYKPDNTVESRPVKVDFLYKDRYVMAEGLEPGEQVVTDGQLDLKSGSKVQVASDEPKGDKSGDKPGGRSKDRSKK